MDNEALPTLEHAAENESRQEGKPRWFGPGPPGHMSSTKAKVDFGQDFALKTDGHLSDKAIAIMDAPLTDDELYDLPYIVDRATEPAISYAKETRYEENRLDGYRPFTANELFWSQTANSELL